MKKYQEAGLTLLDNDITFQNGRLIDEEVLLDEGLVGNRSYRSAEDVQEGRPRNLMYLGEGLITFNDTSFPFPYRPEFFREDGELMGPERILHTAYETVEEIVEALEERDERLEQVEEISDIGEWNRKGNEVKEEFRERYADIFVEGYEPRDVWYDPFPHPDNLEESYDAFWDEGSLDSRPDLSSSEELERFFEEGGEFEDFGLGSMWAKTEGGILFPFYPGMTLDRFGRNSLNAYSDDEDYFKVPKVYHAVGLTLAENDITFRDGVYITDEDLKEAGVIESTNYKNAWDVKMGRPDTVLPLGDGKVTFNNTGFSLPWAKDIFREPVRYGDITSYSGEPETVTVEPGEEISEDSAVLRGPADILRASHQAWQEAREISEEEALEALTAAGVNIENLDDEHHVDPEEINHSYTEEWRKGSIEGLPDFSDPEALLRTIDNVTEIDDVVRKYVRHLKSSQTFRVEESEDPVHRQEDLEEMDERRRLRE
ncbi:MAG: hypothetical protein ACLFTA_03150 [Candidatus Nanohaloarchaea archaeon]